MGGMDGEGCLGSEAEPVAPGLPWGASSILCGVAVLAGAYDIEGEYQTRCARGAHGVRVTGIVAWTVSANLEATCCWPLCFCPTLYLTLQKELGQCSHMQNWDWCAMTCHLPPVAAPVACELGQGGPHTLPYLLPQQPPPRDSIYKGFKGRPFPGEVVQQTDVVRTRCLDSLSAARSI